MNFASIALLSLSLSGTIGVAADPVAGDDRKPHCDSRFAASGPANIALCTAELNAPGLSDNIRAMLLNIRGNNYDFTRQYDLAIADYSEVIRLKPSFLGYAYANRGLEKCRKGQCAGALIDYNEAIRIDPDNTYALYGRGVARVRSGDTAGGHADIDKVNAEDNGDTAKLYVQIDMTP
ncbi:MAG TPA: tetratricopeptide repeat protein [Rhizomicrobium sp.]|nr:tetratricopeptide repeat protein [Rhizomicrobium sp.]